MPPSPQKSELERRFEELFSEVFRCDWRKHLQDEYHVQVDGKNYYIDYVCIAEGRKIAIETDGHGKIKNAIDATQKFHDLLARQNDIIGLGFELYRFGWHHVVSFGGWRARRDLERIFRGLIQPTPQQQAQKQAHPVLSSLPVLWEPRKIKNVVAYTAPQGQYDRPAQSGSVPAEVIETQVLPYQPTPQKFVALRGFMVGALSLAVVVMLLGKIRPPQQPQEETKHTSIIQTKGAVLPIRQEPIKPTHPAQPTQQVVTRTVYVPQPTKPQIIRIETPTLQAPLVTPSTPVQAIESKPTLIQTTEPTKPDSELDEIVAFNPNSGIYHRLHCTWAKRCKHCITIHQSEAGQMGGKPAKTCDPL